MGERILVTGGSGIIGTPLIETFLEAGHEVLNVDYAPPKLSHRGDIWLDLDILDAQALARAAADFDPTHVVHLAATTHTYGEDMAMYRTNTDGVQNVIDALAPLEHVQAAIFTSTKLVVHTTYRQRHREDYYADCCYGHSKVVGELLVRKATDLPCARIIVRPTSVWGPHSQYNAFFNSIARGVYANPGAENPPKSFGFVGNVVHELDRLLHAPREQVDDKLFYLSDYEVTTIRQWADLICDEMGKRRPVTIPSVAMKAVARVGDVFFRMGWHDVPLQSRRLRNMWSDTVTFDMGPTEDVVGPLPYDLKQGVKITVDWMRQEGLL